MIENQIKTNQNIIQELKRQLTNNITNNVDVQNAILNLTKGSIEEGQLNETIKKLILGEYQDFNIAILNSRAYKDVLDKIASNNKELSDSVAKIWGTLYDNKETGTVGITSKVDQLVKDMTYTKALAINNSVRIDTLSDRLYKEITNATIEISKKILEKLKHPKSTNLQLGDIASTLNSTFNNRLTMYAVEASWSRRGTDGKLVNKKVTSKYELAATPLNPLSFIFLENGINDDLPTIPTLQSKINFNNYKFTWTPIEHMGNIKTKVTLEGIPDVDNIKINGNVWVPKPEVGVTIIGKDKITGTLSRVNKTVIFDLSSLGAKADVTIGSVKINHEDVQVKVGKTTGTYDVTSPMDEFNKIIDNINNQVGNMIGNVNGIVDKVNKFSDAIDGQLINRINAYINKFENLLTKANSLLQPAMFYTTNSGSWGQLARVEEGASHLKLNGGQASTVFVASSYSAELLAPAYLKEISVDGGATLTAARQSGSKVVLKSGQYKVGFNATKAGVYTIKYSAVDYFGNTVTKEFFVKVVD